MTALKWIAVLGAAHGLIGVIMGAIGSHATAHWPRNDLVSLGAQFQLFHGIALLGVAALLASGVAGTLGQWSGWLMALGAALFAGALYLHAQAGHAVIPGMAPAGGFAMMGGWVLLAIAVIRG